MRSSLLTRADFPESRLVARLEGGAVYTAERDGKFYIIQDETTMADFLNEEDLRDLADSLVKVLEFDTAAERHAHIRERGWAASGKGQGRYGDS